MDELVVAGQPQAPALMIRSVLDGFYDEYMRTGFTNYEARRQDLDHLRDYSAGFDDTAAFLTQLALLGGAEGEPEGERRDGQDERDRDRVNLSSVHQAKGLEWRTVFILWLTEGMFPGRRVIESQDSDAMEEERRLFYVAVTRAKDDLYLCQPQTWPNNFAGETFQRPSRFLRDIPRDLLDPWNIAAGFGRAY
jgi:DNA helicase-2/ATP-dependent DNA helicase PcrA